MPLLELNFPGNIQFFFQLIAQLCNFQVIPTEEFIAKLTPTGDSKTKVVDEEYQSRFEAMGYGSKELTSSIGQVSLIISLAIILGFFLLMLKVAGSCF